MLIPTPIDFFNSQLFIDFLRIVILIFLVFYSIFALIIVRQVDLMSRTLITPVSPIVKAFSILHGGFAVGFLVLAWGAL